MSWLARAARQDGKRPVVAFVDVVDSVGLYRRLGDRPAETRIVQALETIRTQVATARGRVVKRSGDDLLVSFKHAEQAIDALVEVQRESTLELRIGIHCGAVLRRRGDLFGDTVNIAARLTAVARPRQIVLSNDVFEQLQGASRRASERFDKLKLKGTESPIALYQLRWELDAATAVNTLDTTLLPAPAQLVLEGCGTTLEVPSARDCVIGRDPTCDLIVDHPRVSRFHATVEFQEGRFVLRDHSTNGSVVQSDQDSRGHFLRREALPLRGRGAVCFGQSRRADGHLAARFEYRVA